jgi:hypothetical protein
MAGLAVLAPRLIGICCCFPLRCDSIGGATGASDSIGALALVGAGAALVAV